MKLKKNRTHLKASHESRGAEVRETLIKYFNDQNHFLFHAFNQKHLNVLTFLHQSASGKTLLASYEHQATKPNNFCFHSDLPKYGIIEKGKHPPKENSLEPPQCIVEEKTKNSSSTMNITLTPQPTQATTDLTHRFQCALIKLRKTAESRAADKNTKDEITTCFFTLMKEMKKSEEVCRLVQCWISTSCNDGNTVDFEANPPDYDSFRNEWASQKTHNMVETSPPPANG